MTEKKITARHPGLLWLPESKHSLDMNRVSHVSIVDNTCRVDWKAGGFFDILGKVADIAVIRAYLLREEENRGCGSGNVNWDSFRV